MYYTDGEHVLFIHEAFTPMQRLSKLSCARRASNGTGWMPSGSEKRKRGRKCRKRWRRGRKTRWSKTTTEIRNEKQLLHNISPYTTVDSCMLYLYVHEKCDAHNIWCHIYIYCSAYIRNETIKTSKLELFAAAAATAAAAAIWLLFAVRWLECAYSLSRSLSIAQNEFTYACSGSQQNKILTKSKDWRDTHTYFIKNTKRKKRRRA